MVALLQWILFGALIGWFASVLMVRSSEPRALGNLVAGIVGAVAGGVLSGSGPVRGVLGLNGFATAFIGAFVMLLVVNLWTRVRAR